MHTWISRRLLKSVILSFLLYITSKVTSRLSGTEAACVEILWKSEESCAGPRASAWKAPAQIKHWVQQGHAAPNEPSAAALQDFSMGRLTGSHSSSKSRARTAPALGPGRAGCHRGIADSAFGRCSGRKAKKRSKWEHFCPHCWRTYQLNIPPKQLPRMKRTPCWIPAQVNVRTSVARLNYKRSTARQGRSPLYLHGMRLFSPELPC